MKKVLGVYVVVFFMCFTMSAQDAHFSQFNQAHSYVNPAMTGVFQGNYRLSVNYRNQWSSLLGDNPFMTYSANAEFRNEIGNGDYFSLGVRALYDQAGPAKYTQTQFNIGGSYLKKLASNKRKKSGHYLGGGAQFGMGQNGVNWSGVWFGRQFDQDAQVIDFGAETGETFIDSETQRTRYYMDINAGLLWYSIFHEDLSLYLGGALHHLNAPNISINEQSSLGAQLYRKITIHGGGDIGMNRSMHLLPAFAVWLQGPSVEINIGTNIRFSNFESEDLAFRVGVFNRIANSVDGYRMDALIMSVGFEKEKWKLGLSYDLSLNDLGNYNKRRGAFEISFVYMNINDYGYSRSPILTPLF